MIRRMLLLLLALGSAAGGQGTAERVAGRVVSAKDGRALRRAAVSLRDNKTNVDTATVFSDEEGRYRFAPVPPGKYNLTGRAAGFLPGSYLGHGQLSTAIVTGEGLAVGNLELALTPAASISGRIVDESGEPVRRAQVALYRENPEGAAQPVLRVHNAITEADGTYEFTGLAPGRYFVGANGTPWYAVHPPPESAAQGGPYRASVDPALDVAYPMMFYPASLTAEGAAPIEIKGGEEIDANLQMVPRPALTLTMPRSSDGDNRRFPLLARSVFGLQEPVNAQQMGSGDGMMRMTGLAPGEYVVQEFTPGNGIRERMGTVDLTAGSTTLNVHAAARGTVSVTVRAVDGATLPERVQLTLRGSSPNERASATVDDKGAATFDGVPPGQYRLAANAAGRGLGVSSLTLGGKTVEGRRLTVAEGAHVAAEMVLAGAPVRVEGFVRRKGKADPAAMVVLVPAGADAAEELFRRDQSDLDGSYTFNNVAPGNYLVVAIDEGWPLRWTDAKVLVPYLLHAVPLTVVAKDGLPVKVDEVVEAQTR